MGLARRPLESLYARLGARYPRVVLVLLVMAAHVVVLGGIGLLRIYQPMSAGDFWLIVAGGELTVLVDNLWGLSYAFALVAPVERWLRGERTDASSQEAWRALITLPVEAGTGRGVWPLIFNLVPISIFVVWVLGLPAASVLVVLAGSAVVLAYGVTLRFLSTELAFRPVLREIAAELPDGARLGKSTVSLRAKLLAGLPVINVITGVVVAGLSAAGQSTLRDLGLDVILAVVVAATISFELTLLLSRSILEPVNDLRRATERVAAGDLAVRVPVTTSDETGELATAFNTMVSGLQERATLHEALGSYVDPELAERILREGSTLEGEEVEVSVLFVDIRDFTAFAERSSAREVVLELNRFYDLVVPILTAHHGHANKFVGDGLLGVFGAPDRRADHADCAVAAACAIATAVDAHLREERLRFRIGIGVNSGPVVAGTIGGSGHLEFTVIGDPVNTASRVEALTRETGDVILVTDATRCLLARDHGPMTERPATLVKGKADPVRLWAPDPAPARVRA